MEKREHINFYPGIIKMLLPALFWTKCESCNKDFRFTRGWRTVVGPYHNGIGKWVYICPTCAPNKKLANDLLFERDEKIRRHRPCPPPPPPPPKNLKKGKYHVC